MVRIVNVLFVNVTVIHIVIVNFNRAVERR